jgi:O-antigen/teichoic acid export membrane protein
LQSTSNLSLKNKVLTGLVWRFLERGGTLGMQFIISIVLARLLLPRDFGTIGLLTVFIAVAGVFVQSGFGSALIQKEKVSIEEYSSVFYLSLFVSIVLYILLFFTAPLIASFYSEPLLVSILRVMALSLIIGAITSVQYAVLSREMKFKKSFFASIGGIFASGTVGIAMAYCGYGVWSLVFSQLSSQVLSLIILWFMVKWRPSFIFSFTKLKKLFQYGSKLLCSALLDTIFNNLYSLSIGKLFDLTMLGYYNRGLSIPMLVVENINGTIDGVMFPALSSCQHDRGRVKKLVRRMITTSSFFVIPMMFGLIVVAKPLVLLVFTEKWLPCVPFVQLSCIKCAFWPIHIGNLQAIKAVGRSDIFFRLEIVKKVLFAIVIVLTFPFGIYAMVAGGAVLSVINTIINALPNRKLINYTYKEQWLDIAPFILLSVLMDSVIIGVSVLSLGAEMTLLFQFLVGAAFYFAGAYFFKFECFFYLLTIIKGNYRWRKTT